MAYIIKKELFGLSHPSFIRGCSSNIKFRHWHDSASPLTLGQSQGSVNCLSGEPNCVLRMVHTGGTMSCPSFRERQGHRKSFAHWI